MHRSVRRARTPVGIVRVPSPTTAGNVHLRGPPRAADPCPAVCLNKEARMPRAGCVDGCLERPRRSEATFIYLFITLALVEGGCLCGHRTTCTREHPQHTLTQAPTRTHPHASTHTQAPTRKYPPTHRPADSLRHKHPQTACARGWRPDGQERGGWNPPTAYGTRLRNRTRPNATFVVCNVRTGAVEGDAKTSRIGRHLQKIFPGGILG